MRCLCVILHSLFYDSRTYTTDLADGHSWTEVGCLENFHQSRWYTVGSTMFIVKKGDEHKESDFFFETEVKMNTWR